MTATPPKVRIAPSPSGYLHVGTARAALFNYLFARHNGGKFVVRIEDTDVERSKTEYIEPIIDALRWLGLEWDEEIVYQSKRSDIYAEYLKKFMESGQGYYCFCSKETLDSKRQKAREEKRNPRYDRTCLTLTKEEIRAKLDAGEKPVIRVKMPDGDIQYDDMVSGKLTRSSEELEDFVVARSDGSVTYNFAVVVDDHTMGITHVIRGNDHITNTFKQLVVYKALGVEVPVFGHVPMILRPDKKKVSKRLGDKGVGEFRDEGILPEAMINYLSLLGWSPKTDREIYTKKELIEIFNPDNLNAANAVFDPEKLEAFNREHILLMSDHDLATQLAPLLIEAGYTSKYWLETRWEYLRAVVTLFKERVRRISDFVEQSKYFFDFDYTYDEAADKKRFKPESADVLDEMANRFEALNPFTHDAIEAALTALSEEREIGKGKIIHPTRLAVSGVPAGPGLYDMLAVLGQPAVVERMRKAAEYVRGKA